MKNLSNFFLLMYLKLTEALRNEKGQTLIEYALLVVLIALVVYILVQATGKSTCKVFSKINSVLSTVPN